MFLLVVGSVLVAIILYDIIYRKFFAPLRHLPQPFSWPLVYHMPYLYFNKDHFGQIAKFADQFKEEGLFKFGILSGNPKEILVVVKAELQKQILSRPDIFVRGKVLLKFLPLVGEGILLVEGEQHRFQRKLLGKAFSTGQLKYFIPVFNNHAGVLVERLKNIVKGFESGQNLVIQRFFQDLTFDIIGEIAFGYHFNSQTTETSEFVTTFRKVIEGVFNTNSRILLNLFPFFKYMPFGPAKKMKDANEIGKTVLDEILTSRKEKIAKDDMTEPEKNDMLSMMMEAIDEDTNKGFTDQLLKDNMYTFLIAGHETSATALPGVVFYLAKYPELQERARAEVKEYLNDRTELTFEHLNSFPYVGAFIKESLRLHTPIPFLSRTSVADFTIGKYHIPKGSRFLFPEYYLNKDENTFDEATKFVPDRFLEQCGYKNGTMFTFGYGPYNCIGKNFALQEIKVVIVRLLQNFQFSLDPGCDHYYYRGGFTIKTTSPMKIRVKAL